MLYYCLVKDFSTTNGNITLHKFTVDNEEHAWEKVEEEYRGNMTEEWLFTSRELQKLKNRLNMEEVSSI